MKHLQTYTMGILSLLFLTQYSSISEPETPRVNYSGVINGIYVDYITIAGLTDRIIFYLKPEGSDTNKLNETELSLSRIQTIVPPSNKPLISIYGGKKYVEVLVIDKGNNQRAYLVEQDRKIKAVEKNNGNKDTFYFGSLVKLEIKGPPSCEQK